MKYFSFWVYRFLDFAITRIMKISRVGRLLYYNTYICSLFCTVSVDSSAEDSLSELLIVTDSCRQSPIVEQKCALCSKCSTCLQLIVLSGWRNYVIVEDRALIRGIPSGPSDKIAQMWNVTPALRAPFFFAFLCNHGGANTTTNTSARGAVNKLAQ